MTANLTHRQVAAAGAVALVLTAVASPATAGDSLGWFLFTPPGGEIAVVVPSEPTLERQDTETIVGTVHTRIWHSTLEDRQYWISHTTLPPIAAFFSPRGLVYEKSKENLMRELGAEVISFVERDGDLLERELRYRIPARDGEPAREGRIGMRLVGDTLVSVNASAPVGETYRLAGFFYYVQAVPGTDTCLAHCARDQSVDADATVEATTDAERALPLAG